MYAVAKNIWGIVRYIWAAIILAILIGFLANVLSGKPEDVYRTTLISIGTWLFGQEIYQRFTLAAIAIFIIVSFSSWLISLRSPKSQPTSTLSREIQPVISQLQTISNHLQTITGVLRDNLEAEKVLKAREQGKDNSALMRYLRFIEESNSNVDFGKIAAHPQTFVSANVPLDDIFVHLQVVPDRPVYDTSQDQQKLIDAIRQCTALNIDEREAYIQRLAVSWQSQQGKRWAGVQQSIPIEEALQQLGPENTTAVILGSPGAGKSTIIRWLALKMAQAFRPSGTSLADNLSPRQIPILIPISEYKESLEKHHFSIKQFLSTQLGEIHPDLPNILLNELASGHCLILFDGLNELASDDVRRRAAEAISTFIAEYSSSSKALQLPTFNRFIITTRIVGYEPGTFAEWAHYTLIDLDDQQIGQLLTNWCPAIERYKVMSVHGMQSLTEAEKADASTASIQQRDYLLNMLENYPGLKKVASNPLTFTIMTLMQLNGTNILYHRYDLYHAATRIFLEISRRKGDVLFNGEARLAERMLSNIAYQLQNNKPVLTEYDVIGIALQTIGDFSQRETSTLNDKEIKQLLETLRMSGLFIECGKDLFCFAQHAFQEYFVALYLMHKPLSELKEFAVQNYSQDTWREPLLLALSSKSRQSNRNEQRETVEIIKATAEILDTEATYNDLFHHNLLFTVSCVADSDALSVDRTIQYQIANLMFDLYENVFGLGTPIQLQEINKIALYWLKAQPQVRGKEETTLPLLECWRTALCDTTQLVRQEGAIHLLAELAPDLSNQMLSVLVLRNFIPPLLQLAGLLYLDLPYPGAVRQHLPQPPACAASQRAEEYAYVALRRLDIYGPAKWLHDKWLEWNEKQPQLLVNLTEHSQELLYLITPAALPNKANSPYWDVQRKIGNTWQQHSHNLQTQLLNASDIARYPHAYLLHQLLESESASESSANLPWYILWDTMLQEEMRHGRSATYLACLSLRLLLSRVIEQQPQRLANELEASLLVQDRQQIQALIVIAHLCWRNAQVAPELQDMLEVRKMLDYLNTRDTIDIQDLQTPNSMRYTEYVLSLRNALDIKKIGDKLCDQLEKSESTPGNVLLFTLYCIIVFNQSVTLSFIKRVQSILQKVAQRSGQHISTENRQLIETTQRYISESIKRFSSPM